MYYEETDSDFQEETLETDIFWNWKTALVMFVIVILLANIVGGIFQLFNIYLGLIITEILIALPVIIYIAYLKKRSTTIFGLKLKIDRELGKDLIYAVIGVIVGYFVATVAAIITQMILGPSPFEELYSELLTPKTVFDLVIWIAIMGAFVAPCEEIFARGFVQQGMEKSFGKKKGLIIAAILFGLFHVDPWRIPATAALGFVFGYIYQKRNYRLSAPILTHFLNNAMVITLLFLIQI